MLFAVAFPPPPEHIPLPFATHPTRIPSSTLSWMSPLPTWSLLPDLNHTPKPELLDDSKFTSSLLPALKKKTPALALPATLMFSIRTSLPSFSMPYFHQLMVGGSAAAPWPSIQTDDAFLT